MRSQQAVVLIEIHWLSQARREKISERMKILQDLVPGCNKVLLNATIPYCAAQVYVAWYHMWFFCRSASWLQHIYDLVFAFPLELAFANINLYLWNCSCKQVIGKASVLDEIINYIQALQRQVEVCISLACTLSTIFTVVMLILDFTVPINEARSRKFPHQCWHWRVPSQGCELMQMHIEQFHLLYIYSTWIYLFWMFVILGQSLGCGNCINNLLCFHQANVLQHCSLFLGYVMKSLILVLWFITTISRLKIIFFRVWIWINMLVLIP